MRITRGLVFVALLLFATSASAADLCFDDDGGGGTIYHFKKIKLPKQPIDAVPVAGVRLGMSGVGGTAFRDASGQLRLSLVIESGACFVSVTLDDALEGVPATPASAASPPRPTGRRATALRSSTERRPEPPR